MIRTDGYSRAQLRRVLRNARNQLSPLQQRAAAQALYRNLAQHPLFRRARHLGLYLAEDGEIDPHFLLREAHRRGKAVYLPVLHAWPRTRMDFQRLTPEEPLQRNRFGILEPRPTPCRQRAPWALDLILMPLVGFDEGGGRLGMGGGFYDRSLAYLRRRKTWHGPVLLGLAHECQKVDHLPLAAWDVGMQAIVTDRRCYAGSRITATLDTDENATAE